MENVNLNIRDKLIQHCNGPVAELAIKAIALSDEHNSPSDVAEQIKPLIRKYVKLFGKGGKE